MELVKLIESKEYENSKKYIFKIPAESIKDYRKELTNWLFGLFSSDDEKVKEFIFRVQNEESRNKLSQIIYKMIKEDENLKERISKTILYYIIIKK